MYARRALGCALALLAAVALSASARAQDVPVPPDGDTPDVPDTPEPPDTYRQPPEWRWVQVLAAPRIGARLTAIALDPAHPERIFVGSQSGVIFYSGDRGVTWRELEPDAFTANRRDVIPLRGGSCVRPDCNETPLWFQFPANPMRPPTGSRTGLIVDQLLLPGPYGGTFGRGFFLPPYATEGQATNLRLLDNAVRSRSTEEVRKIVICPGSVYSMVAATRREVIASPDEGWSWVRLIRFPGNIETPQIACDPLRTNHLIIASDAGYQESRDGGITLDPNLAGYPRGQVQAVEFGTDGSLYLASGFQLFKRGVDEVDAQRIYPDFNNSQTAPWEPILWIEPDQDEVWLATQDGLRHSEDNGQRFTQIAPNLFSRQVVQQVVVGRNESNQHRVAAIVRDCPRDARTVAAPGCRGTLVLSSDDGGNHWDPFFQGISRRSVQQMAYGDGYWFVLTGGELWMTSRATPGAVQQSIVEDARRAIETTPTLSTIIESSLDHLSLNQEQVNSLIDRAYASSWLPRRFSLHFQADIDLFDDTSTRMGVAPNTLAADNNFSFFYFWAFLEWDLQGTTGVWNTQSGVRREPIWRARLYQLRQQISFVIEDAWHERRMHLRRIARGFTDPYQAAVLLERIEVLEAILEFWLGDELEAFAPHPRRR